MSEKTKSRLGRGLSSLISMEIPVQREQPDDAPPGTPSPSLPSAGHPARDESASVHELPLHAITANPHQPRRTFDESALASLAASFASAGVIQPILVRRIKADQYELIAGERRWRAARLAGLGSIPALIREADRVAQAQLALIENTQREDLNPIERAAAYQTLLRELNLTQAELSDRVGEDRSSIANFLRLLDLPAGARAFIQEGTLSLGHAKVLAALSDSETIESLATKVVEGGWSVRALERAVAGARANITLPAPIDDARIAHLHETASAIERSIGMKVKLKSSKKGSGKLTIQYSSLSQFDELMEKLGVRFEAM